MISRKVVIIGAGPGGYVAAIRAAQLGCEVTLIEKELVGGVCLNSGCIPTKALVASAQLLHDMRRAVEFGIDLTGELLLNWERVSKRKDAVVNRLNHGVTFLLKKNKVNLVKGTGRFLSPKEIAVLTEGGTEEILTADSFIIATGTVPAVAPLFSFDGHTVINSDQLLNLNELPKSIIIVGGGVIGCEFAAILNEFGVKTTIVELLPRLLPMVEADLGLNLANIFKKRGIAVKTAVKVMKVINNGASAALILENGESLEAEQVLVSIGRQAATDSLNLAAAGVKTNKQGKIAVDLRLHTNVPHIYAIGDVNSLRFDLAHAAFYQAKVAVEDLTGAGDGIAREVNEQLIPNCIFTIPELASVGMSEAEAQEGGLTVKTGKFPYIASGKALAMGETDGFVKLIADSATDKVLGIHIMGIHASDVIAEATLAISSGLTASELGRVIHAHPTLAEALMEAAEMIHNQAIHL